MAAGDVNAQNVDIDGAGNIALTGSPTGTGIYAVGTNGGAATDQLITISGGSGYAWIKLRPRVVGQYFELVHDGTHIILQEDQNFTPQSINDSIVLYDRDGDGTVWVEAVPRMRFPV